MKFDTRKIEAEIDQIAEVSMIEDYFARNEEGELIAIDAIFLNGTPVMSPLVAHKKCSSAVEFFDLVDAMTEQKFSAGRDALERDYKVVLALASAAVEFARRSVELNEGKSSLADTEKAKYLAEPIGICMLGHHCFSEVGTLRATELSGIERIEEWLEKYPIDLSFGKNPRGEA